MEFRLMMVTTTTEKKQAKIMITGSLLDRFGFVPEMLVTVFSEKDVLTMKACGTGLDSYQQVVWQVRKQRGHLLQVFNWKRKKTETHLVLEGTWLEKQGFLVGDIILVQFDQGMIRIKRLQPQELGFISGPDTSYHIIRVWDNGHAPQIGLNGDYLSNYGFVTGQTASVTYEPNSITFRPVSESWVKRNHEPQPLKINILSRGNAPYLCLSGAWLHELGYEPGDFLILQRQLGQLQFRRLEDHHFQF